MSDYNWCHGPECHTRHTQSRIRGSGRDKVLRTVKIKVNSRNQFGNNIFDYFCNQNCLHEYLNKYAQAISAIAPRRQALETPIKVEKVQEKDYYNYPYTRTRIIRVDNSNG